MPRPRVPASPFRYFNSSPEVIRLAVLLYVKYPLSLRNVEDLLAERGIDISHETVRNWWNRFGPLFGLRPRQRPQSLQFRTSPRRQINVQATPLGSTCRVAVAVQLILLIKDTGLPIREMCALV